MVGIWVWSLQGGGPCGRLYGSFSNSRRRGRSNANGDGCLWILAGNWDLLHEYRQLQVDVYVTCATWIVTTILHCLVEPAYGAGETFQAKGATIASADVGFFLMPVYLDHLVRTTPLIVNPQDYGLSVDANPGRPDLLVTWVYGNIKERRPSPLPPPQEQDDKYPFSR